MSTQLYPTKEMLDSFLKSLIAKSSWLLQKKGYVAPTFFLLKGKTISGYNYYNSLQDAFNKVKYLVREGGADVRPAGSIPFTKDGTPQTAGINCDFYFAVNPLLTINLGYEAVKYWYEKYPQVLFCIVRFYKTDGSGPFFSVLDRRYFGVTATPVSSYSYDKISAIDKFNREAALLKAQHNSLAGYLNAMASKTMSPVEQQIFNKGSLRLQTMRAEMSQIEGLEIYYSNDGRIGAIQIGHIGWIIIGSVIAGWAASKILTEAEKTKRVVASYNHQQWAADQKLLIAQEVTKGSITKEQASVLSKDLDVMIKTAGENAAAASAPSQSMFGEIGEIVKWAAIGFGLYAVSKSIGKK